VRGCFFEIKTNSLPVINGSPFALNPAWFSGFGGIIISLAIRGLTTSASLIAEK